MSEKRPEKPKLSVVGQAVAKKPGELHRPSFAVYDHPTEVDGKAYRPGTWLHGIKHGNGESEGTPFDSWICAPLRVEAETVNSEDGSIGRLLSWHHQGKRIEWVMPMEMIAGKGDEILKSLMRQGLAVEYSQRRHVPAYIASHLAPTRTLATTTKPGWHESGAFVLPHRVIGGKDVRHQDSGRSVSIFGSRGTLNDWQAEVARYCRDNPVLLLAVSCALAGPLLYKVNVNGGGVHLVGDSSSGKSLAQLLAASVWGNPGVFAASWDLSKGGIEIEAASRNDTVLLLDEIKRADPKRVQEMAYAIANGTGKGTMTRDREGRPKLYWRVLALSSGERSLSEHAAISGSPAHAGAELRMVDVNAGTRRYRAFDELHDMSGEVFHRTLTGAASRQYGHAGPAFVEKLIKEADDKLIQEFARRREMFDVDSAQAGRVADRFAVIALAGELATSYGLLPWEKGETENACRLLFREWLARVGTGNAEDRQILTAIADFIAQHGDSRFSNLRDIGAIVPGRAGYFEKVDEDRLLFLFNRKGLTDAAAGFGTERIVRALQAAGVIAKTGEGGRPSKNYRLPGGRTQRLYVVDPQKLEEATQE
jgi:putative DNA primase/helicase